ncbi:MULTISPECIES: AmmeMemoRadiSam system protein B [Psychrilyobacter]|nr:MULTISPECIES: AmmeMemoRadiSam system protein B [Psychrilyobacter]MCS5421024.1 AmmeMemoRadiSam system protein B [Psychrilyobacter sp. S5]NDI76691.1 AmmeMemoRadiSam system protein B [Psychrilyobacter piezotolerans]
MKKREEFVRGKFYPEKKKDIEKMIENFLKIESPKKKDGEILGGIVPHAGYEFSGPSAVHFFNTLKEKDIETVIIVNPSHTGYGEDINLDTNEVWGSPMGDLEIDLDFEKELDLPYSGDAHKFEHSGEVMLPFLKYFIKSEFKIVPITMKIQTYKNAKYLAEKIDEAAKKQRKKILVIASSDFSHYEKKEVGYRLDQLAIDRIMELDSQGVENTVDEYNLSICGYGPIMTLLEYSKLVADDPKIEILRRGHSGENYPMEEVVDYITFLVYK